MTITRGVLDLDPERCTSCMLCVRECPTWCISLDAHHAVDPATASLPRPRTINVLDDFRIDMARCMHCSICVEVCPFDALAWVPDFDDPSATRAQAVHHWSQRLATVSG